MLGQPRLRFVALVVIVGGAALVVATVGACNSTADDICENVGACEQGGSSDWVKSCQDEAKALESAAAGVSCDGFLSVYYRCAKDTFTCEGATASFPGCEAKRGNLDDCFVREGAKTACGELATKTGACKTVDASVSAPPASATACTAARECAARCYLDNVTDPCAPRPGELEATASCISSCPP